MWQLVGHAGRYPPFVNNFNFRPRLRGFMKRNTFVSLNPQNTNGVQMLKKLEGK